jgi:hypothetical protein
MMSYKHQETKTEKSKLPAGEQALEDRQLPINVDPITPNNVENNVENEQEQNELLVTSSDLGDEQIQHIQTGNDILNEMVREDNKRSIFRKADDRRVVGSDVTSSSRARETYTVLSSKDLARSIPPAVTVEPLQSIPTGLVEWRWRFFKIGKRKLVEVSHFDGNKRIYTDYNGNKIEFEMNREWDQYLVKTLYAYARAQ